jgi:hypothetical protein
MLIAEEDHRILGQRAMDLVERAIAERLRQIDPADLPADDRRQLVYRDVSYGAGSSAMCL